MMVDTKVMMGGQLSTNAGSATSFLTNASDGQGMSVIALSHSELEEIIIGEWDFTSSKIQDNFSNGSAFHYRSKLLPLVLEMRLSSAPDGAKEKGNSAPHDRNQAVLALAREEWEDIVLNAVFTEPDDQTPWWYHRFVVAWAQPSGDAAESDVEEYAALLFDMAEALRDLLAVEKENDDAAATTTTTTTTTDESKGAKCKWAYVGLHLVLSTLRESASLEEEAAAEVAAEASECLAELTRIDPDRKERYQNLAAETNE